MDGDTERLRQVLDNLIGNALQHTPRRTIAAIFGTPRLGIAARHPARELVERS